jgi:putative thioredoxin
MLMPVLVKLVQAYQGKFRLAKVNIDEQQELAAQFGVRSVPTVKLLKGGKIVDEFLGALPEGNIRALLDRHIERDSDVQMRAAMTRYRGGDSAAAISALQAVAAADPDNPRVRRQLLEVLVEQGRTQEAEQLLAAMPYEERESAELAALRGRLSFAAIARDAPELAVLEQAVRENTNDSAARYQLSARYVLRGELEPAMQQLLEIIKRDRRFGDDAGRKALLQIFDILGGKGELVNRYRSRMSAALY